MRIWIQCNSIHCTNLQVVESTEKQIDADLFQIKGLTPRQSVEASAQQISQFINKADEEPAIKNFHFDCTSKAYGRAVLVGGSAERESQFRGTVEGEVGPLQRSVHTIVWSGPTRYANVVLHDVHVGRSHRSWLGRHAGAPLSPCQTECSTKKQHSHHSKKKVVFLVSCERASRLTDGIGALKRSMVGGSSEGSTMTEGCPSCLRAERGRSAVGHSEERDARRSRIAVNDRALHSWKVHVRDCCEINNGFGMQF